MSAYVPAAVRRQVRERFAERCGYCRTAEGLTATAFENLCLACPMCNRFKATATTATDPGTAAVVPLFHPHRDVWSDHFEWSADATEVVGRTPVGRATAAAFRMNRPAMIRVRRMWAALGEHPPQTD